MNTSSTHGSSMNTSAHGSTIHRTSMTFRKSEPAKYDYEMPSRSQHGTATGTNDNNNNEEEEEEEEDEDVPTTEAVVDETPVTPFWENSTDDDDDDDDDDSAVDTFFAKLFKRAEGKEDASTANNPANDPANDDDDDASVDTFFAKLFKKNDANADDDDDDDNASASIDRNYGDFLQYMDFLELVEFMTVLKTKTTGMPPRKIESKVEQLEKLMEETKGQTDLNDDGNDGSSSSSTWKFLEFLMGKKNDEHPETKVHYRNFLQWLSSPPGTTPASFRSETKGPSEEDIWKEIAEGMAPKEERVSGKVSMAALWSYIATPPFAEGEESSTSASTTKRSGIWSWFGYAADATPKGMERKDADGGIEKARELEEDTNTSTGTASSDNHIV